jgi:hypothetical protein
MGLLDRLFGRTPRRDDASYRSSPGAPAYGTPSGPSSSYPPEPGTPAYGTPPSSYPPEPGADDRARGDEEAVRRYRYLLRTAPPDAIEQAHAEAFAQLTPEQRRQVLGQLANNVPEYERVRDDDPRTLARMATRAEMRQPGFLERTFGGYGPGYGRGYGPGYGGGMMGGGMTGGGFGMGGMGMGGMGMGGMLAGGLLASIAGSFIGTAIAEEMFDHDEYMASGFADGGDGGGDAFGDFGDGGGDFGDGGGDFGGGDFGGGGDW